MMGEVRLDKERKLIIIEALLIFYGNAANEELSHIIARNIEDHWNEPRASVRINESWYNAEFRISGAYDPLLTETVIYENTDPRKNYFRVEAFAAGNISFVDGINSNTGYFKLENLLHNSTTAAHEFGHTLGLLHPEILDIRGKGRPGIMYPRGTIVDPVYQYDPAASPGAAGGTMNPFSRRVSLDDITDLQLQSLHYNDQSIAVLGDFSSVWHDAHEPAVSQ